MWEDDMCLYADSWEMIANKERETWSIDLLLFERQIFVYKIETYAFWYMKASDDSIRL